MQFVISIFDSGCSVNSQNKKNHDDNCLMGGLSPIVEIIIHGSLDSEQRMNLESPLIHISRQIPNDLIESPCD